MIRNLVLLLEIFTFLYGFAAVYGKKMKYEIYDVILVIANMVLLVGINENSIPAYLVSLTYVTMCVYCMLKYHATIKRVVLNFFIIFAVIAATQALCFMCVSVFYNEKTNNTDIRGMVASAIQLVSFIFLLPKMKLVELSDFLIKKAWVSAVIGFFILVVLGNEAWKIKSLGFLEASDYVPVIYFVVLILVMMYEWQKTKAEAEVEKARMEMNTLYYGAYEGLIQSIRDKQHDFKNHISAISGMLYSEASCDEIVEQQKRYFSEMVGEVKDTSCLTMIENPAISGIIIHKIREAQECGIEIEQKCSFTSQALKVPEYRLVEMIGILWDNAMEAIPLGQQNKKIWIQLWKENNSFWFSIQNCYEGEILSDEIFVRGYSSKGKGRGIGLAKLQRLLKMNEGNMYIEHGRNGEYKTIKFVICVPI